MVQGRSRRPPSSRPMRPAAPTSAEASGVECALMVPFIPDSSGSLRQPEAPADEERPIPRHDGEPQYHEISAAACRARKAEGGVRGRSGADRAEGDRLEEGLAAELGPSDP